MNQAHYSEVDGSLRQRKSAGRANEDRPVEVGPAGKLAQILFGFNSGVEIRQLTVVMLLVGTTRLLVRYRLALPRPIVVDVCASALVALGLFWFTTCTF